MRTAGGYAAHVFHKGLGELPATVQGSRRARCFQAGLPRLKLLTVCGSAADIKAALAQQQLCLFDTADNAVALGGEPHDSLRCADAQQFNGKIKTGAIVCQQPFKPGIGTGKVHGLLLLNTG